jgi:hypothetical protein
MGAKVFQHILNKLSYIYILHLGHGPIDVLIERSPYILSIVTALYQFVLTVCHSISINLLCPVTTRLANLNAIYMQCCMLNVAKNNP